MAIVLILNSISLKQNKHITSNLIWIMKIRVETSNRIGGQRELFATLLFAARRPASLWTLPLPRTSCSLSGQRRRALDFFGLGREPLEHWSIPQHIGNYHEPYLPSSEVNLVVFGT